MGPSSGKERRNFRAIARASFRFPELKAGWPQHVWERGTRTVAPNRSRTSTVASQTPGEKASARQVKKRETAMGPFGSILVVYVMGSPREASFRGRTPARKEGLLSTTLPRKDAVGPATELQGFLPPFSGPDPDRLLEVKDEYLPVSDLPRVRGGQDPFDHRGYKLVVHCRLDLDLGDEVDHVLRPAVHLGVPLLPPEPLHFQDGHSGHARLGERLLHIVKLERLDDCFDLLHGAPPVRGSVRLSGGSSAG